MTNTESANESFIADLARSAGFGSVASFSDPLARDGADGLVGVVFFDHENVEMDGGPVAAFILHRRDGSGAVFADMWDVRLSAPRADLVAGFDRLVAALA